MIIAPGTNVRFLKNVPLDNTYEHTIYFASEPAQQTYFNSLAKYRYTDFTYQRAGSGVIRVGRKADDLYDCNYVMFQNANFGPKWFYAFVTGVEYVNNECCNVTYQIDVMQTWFFDYSFTRTFVEREHSATDLIGDNILPEPVNVGEYVFNGYEPVATMNDYIVIIAIVDTDETADGTVYDRVYGGATLWAYDSGDVQGINAKISEYVQKPDAINAIYMAPKILIANRIPDNHKLTYGTSGHVETVTLPAGLANQTLDGYTPKNRKLFTYPYNYLHIDNAEGSSLTLRYEFFAGNIPVVEYGGTVTQPVQVVLRPCSYKGVPAYSDLGGYHTLNTEALTLGNYPICSWNVDSYQAWVAQNSVPYIANVLPALASTVTGNAAGLENALDITKQTLMNAYSASIAADISRGSFNNGGADVAMNKKKFWYGRVSVNRQFARMIDDFFSVYGYACNMVKVPNRNVRPHWNYVKTVGCNVHGSVPADDMREICEIYDRGITFWKNGDEIGDYSLDNSV